VAAEGNIMGRISIALALSALLIAPAGRLNAAGPFTEAPETAALVQQGKLPPLPQRLPQQPQIVQPDSIGRYGGELRSALRGDDDQNSILRLVGPQGLTRWAPDYESVVPNVAEGWTRSADATEYTFRLRTGMRWSDGQPFGTDDILFFVNDLMTDPEFFNAPPSQYVVNGKPMRAEKIDDVTVKLILGGPSLRFPELLATPLGQHPVLYQKRYCSRFVPKYNPDIAKLLAEAHQSDWSALLRQRCGDIEIPSRWGNPDRPTLDPWVIATPYTGGGTQVLMRRNPYFWQVDPAGNQLPYIGTLNLRIISDIQSITLAAIGGQLDLMVRHINLIGNKPVLAQHAAEGRYVLQPLTSTQAAALVMWFNQTSRNPKLRDLLRNHDFRQALSLGMDREEINDIVFLGQSKPWQTSPDEADKFFNKQLALQYTERDVDGANAILDRLGLAKRNPAGIRLLPDGSRLFITIDASLADAGAADALELVKKQWAEIGVDVGIKNEERSLFYDRGQNNDYDVAISAATGGLDPTSDPRLWLSTHTLDSRQSIPWVRWYSSGGRTGEAPSQSMRERLALWDQWKQAASPDQADTLFREILQKAADAFEVMGLVHGLTTYGIRSVDLRNVPATMPNSWNYPTPAPTLLQQYYFAR
jgi:peptide/nickel transport system substrate-binding protein